MAFALAQSVIHNQGTSSSAAATYGSAVGVGDLLLAWVTGYNTLAPGTLTIGDTVNTWHILTPESSPTGGIVEGVWCWTLATTAVALTVTATWSTASTNATIFIYDYTGNGTSPVGTPGSANGASGTVSAGSFTPSTANSLIVCGAAANISTPNFTKGASFSVAAQNQVSGVVLSSAGEYLIQSGGPTGITAAFLTSATADWVCVAQEFTQTNTPTTVNSLLLMGT